MMVAEPVSFVHRVQCQCCTAKPQTLATIADGRLCIRARRDKCWHEVTFGAELCDRLHWNGKLACDCCAPPKVKLLGECLDGVLIIRAVRHGAVHFVALGEQKLRQLLASSTEAAYHHSTLPMGEGKELHHG